MSHPHLQWVGHLADYQPLLELSKTLDAPAPAHLKEMYKLIRFVLSTKDYGLKFKLIKSMRKWVLKALSDSDFASDKETRISIFGYAIYFCGNTNCLEKQRNEE